MSDKDGIMIGVNKANSSLVIIDIFNSLKYKNANIAIFGTSGSGKTFLIAAYGIRMRQKTYRYLLLLRIKDMNLQEPVTTLVENLYRFLFIVELHQHNGNTACRYGNSRFIGWVYI